MKNTGKDFLSSATSEFRHLNKLRLQRNQKIQDKKTDDIAFFEYLLLFINIKINLSIDNKMIKTNPEILPELNSKLQNYAHQLQDIRNSASGNLQNPENLNKLFTRIDNEINKINIVINNNGPHQTRSLQMNGYRTTSRHSLQMNGYRTTSRPSPQMNGYRTTSRPSLQMNRYRTTSRPTPQMNGYRTTSRPSPQMNGYRSRNR